MPIEDKGPTEPKDFDTISYMDIKKFREEGYLQELNRQFLHPLGLALEVSQHADGSESLGGIWDYREDPEGIIFDKGDEPTEDQRRRRQERINKQERLRRDTRINSLGYWVQPLEEEF